MQALAGGDLSPALEAIGALGDGPVHVSFDIDGVDPAFAPGTGTPEVGGLTSREALMVVRSLVGREIVSADLVEFSPPYDHGISVLALNRLRTGAAARAP